MKKSERFITALVRLVVRRDAAIAVVWALLAVVGGVFTARLYANLRTGLEELLPSSAPSVVDLERIGSRLKSVENLVILTFSSEPAASKRFVTDLAGRMAALPEGLVARVEYRIDKEIEFFRKRAALFIAYEDLENLKRYAEQRILYEADSMGLGLGLVEKPEFDFESFQRKYADRTDWLQRFPDGYFATPDRTVRLISLTLPGLPGDIEAAHRLKAAVTTAVNDLAPKSYAPDLEVHYTGNTEILIEEHAAIVQDVKFTSFTVLLLVMAAMLLYFRSAWSTAALLVSAVVGTLCSLGASFFFAGYLNANSAFLASIVLGNGINFGIILLARYLEERRRSRSHLRALVVGMKRTYKATLAASLAAGAAYGSLTLTDFRGLSQFGKIGLGGMIVCWLSAFTLLPALLHLIYRWRDPEIAKRPARQFSPTIYLAGLVERRARLIVCVSFVITLVMVLGLLFHDRDMLELDMNRLRDRNSVQSGAGYYYPYISKIFGRNLSATVMLTDTRDEARRLATALRARKGQEGGKSSIAWVQTLDDAIPTEQARKLALLREFRKILTPSVVKRMPTEYRGLAGIVNDSEGITPFSENDLSPFFLDKFTERDGRRGNLVLVDKPVVPEGEKENALVILEYVRSLRETASRIGPSIAIAGYLPVAADMMTAILYAGPQTTLISCFAVFCLVALLFRNLKMVLLVTSSLWLGVLWMGGIALGLDIKINFLNFIALPITFGIGVDYGVNVFQRYREEGRRSLLDSIRHTGGAVALCSLTTVIGYASLVLAGNQAFASFGTLAVLGEICCVITAIVIVPAYLMAQRRRQASP